MMGSSFDRRAAQAGFATGLRSTTPLALTSWAASRGALSLPEHGPLSVLSRSLTARLLIYGAAFELVGDKMPFTPARTAPGPLVGRLLMGATVAAALAPSGRRQWAVPSGAAGALLGSYAGLGWRSALVKAGLPDPVGALIEDGCALWLAAQAVRGEQKGTIA